MNRRDAILSTGSMVVSASISALACGGRPADAQTPANNNSKVAPPPTTGGDNGILAAAHDCMLKGDACLSHCLDLLGTGDTSMKDCSHSVRLMNAMMVGLAAAAAANSPRLSELAKVAMKFCQDCEAACKPHAGHHATCRECMEACQRTIAACAKV